MSPTIFALSSGTGTAGVAVIRASGPAVPAVIAAFGLGSLPPRAAKLANIIDPANGETIDSALALHFPAPRSYTGEDVLELHVHGGRAVIAAMLGALSRIKGCRLAEAGEFTRRAFHNGKLDLTQAEAIADLVDSETEAQRKQAVHDINKVKQGRIGDWREQLIDVMALMEASLDFSDEADVAADAVNQARALVTKLHAEIAGSLNDGRRGEIMREGFRVVIAGPPNAGKSSLLNALARRDVAIVSPEPGTTRDVVEARLDLGGYPVIVSDTAGIRADPAGAVEAEGIRRSFAQAGEADLVIWLIDAGAPQPAPPQELLDQGAPLLPILNKADLGRPADFPHTAAISTTTGEGLPGLLGLITEQAKSRLDTGEPPLITTARQRALVVAAQASLTAFLAGDPAHAELRAEDLRQAAQSLGRISGRVDAEDVLDQVFGRFCIGK